MVNVKKKTTKILPDVPERWAFSLLAAHGLNLLVFVASVKTILEWKDSTEALAFYGVYHRNPLNQIIHFFGVPLILWTQLVFSSHLILVRIVVPFVQPVHYVSWATVWAILYVCFYLKIDAFGALLYAPVLFGMYATAIRWAAHDQQEYVKRSKRTHWMGTGRLLQYASFFHVLGWYVQVHPGHFIFEGAAPAALRSLGGAITTAPLFAFYEGVWYCGFAKELQHRVLELVDVYTKKLCDQGATMRVCESL